MKKRWEYQPPLLETSVHLQNWFQWLPAVSLVLFSRTIHNKLGTPEGEPIASSSDDLLGGIAPVRNLIVKILHPVNT